MKKAYYQAVKAYEINEVPIGCIIVYENRIIASGFNKRICNKNVLAHAEIIAINEACNYIGDWRLENCTIFVTVEPCPMCAGAIVQSRMKELVFATRNKKAGCCGSIFNIVNDSRFNHQVNIVEGIMEKECSLIMSNFFSNFRNKK